MLLLTLMATGLAALPAQESSAAPDPLTLDDALFAIPGAGHEVRTIGDLDGDGDGKGDLLIGLRALDVEDASTTLAKAGVVYVLSGADGARLLEVRGRAPEEALGSSVAFTGDGNGDRCSDFAIGAAELDPDRAWVHFEELGRIVSYDGIDGRDYVVYADGSRIDVRTYWQEALARRSPKTGYVSLRSGEDGAELWRAPGLLAGHAFGSALRSAGDTNGDGCADVAVGEADFHLAGPGDGTGIERTPDLGSLTLDQALRIDSNPWCAFQWHSGALLIYSGSTRKVIFGVWGAAGSVDGVGLDAARLGDLNGDGYPEILVVAGDAAHVFAGPGAAPGSDPRPGGAEPEEREGEKQGEK